jgi:hypothetical protein
MHLQHFRDHAIEYFDGLLRVRIADFVSSDSIQRSVSFFSSSVLLKS